MKKMLMIKFQIELHQFQALIQYIMYIPLIISIPEHLVRTT